MHGMFGTVGLVGVAGLQPIFFFPAMTSPAQYY